MPRLLQQKHLAAKFRHAVHRRWKTDHQRPERHAHHRQGISLSGGDPLHPQNVPEILKLVKRIRAECPGKDIWVWTGYKLDELNARK
jgi:organic radical activating enzyme